MCIRDRLFLWVLLQVFNTENIIILDSVVGKVILTLTNTTYITRIFASKLPELVQTTPTEGYHPQ